ncbi:DUF1753-domain-containing protein [Schizopora paradoxa]|uniref:DUF1753-domain-containing protein n=1 Tax=Schizopora paradoxa TaxID=27342 RepID=A0A0H2S489_9AGAM|nr:DUF1753-domain-containing protein [Schizopora paradoxa]
MKLMWRQQWRPRPLNSFLGFVDLKLGVTIALLFAVLNKVAGIYGIIALFNGAGGSFAQVSMYVYSVLMLVALWWGLKAVSEEHPKRTLYFAHLFFVDHVLSTAWVAVFAVAWWVYTPHDGRQQSHSPAQQHIIDVAGGGHNLTESQRAEAAMSIWRKEKGTAASIVVLGWFAKIYFAILLSLPRSNPMLSNDPDYIALDGVPEDILNGALDDEEALPADEYYGAGGSQAARRPRTPGTSGSISSFADFISAPGGRGRRGTGSRPGSASFRNSEFAFPKPSRSISSKVAEEADEVLFDSDEHSKYAGASTEESVSVSSADVRDEGSRRDR